MAIRRETGSEKRRREVADSLAYAAAAARDPKVAQHEAQLRAEMAAGGLDDANEVDPEQITARLTELDRRRS